MTNKELAVQLYCAKLQTFYAVIYQEKIKLDRHASVMPTTEEMIAEIKLIKAELDATFSE